MVRLTGFGEGETVGLRQGVLLRSSLPFCIDAELPDLFVIVEPTCRVAGDWHKVRIRADKIAGVKLLTLQEIETHTL